MASHIAHIERTNRQALDKIEVTVTVQELSSGRHSWNGEFVSRSADGFLPSEQLRLTLDNGPKGTAKVSRTHFDSRSPLTTRVEFAGSGQLA